MEHHPPDDAHPGGRMNLIRETSPLREQLEASLSENRARHQALTQALLDRIDVKKVAQDDKGLPPEKSAISSEISGRWRLRCGRGRSRATSRSEIMSEGQCPTCAPLDVGS